MAAIICKRTVKCQNCRHYKFDEDEDDYSCFARQDGALNFLDEVTDETSEASAKKNKDTKNN